MLAGSPWASQYAHFDCDGFVAFFVANTAVWAGFSGYAVKYPLYRQKLRFGAAPSYGGSRGLQTYKALIHLFEITDGDQCMSSAGSRNP